MLLGGGWRGLLRECCLLLHWRFVHPDHRGALLGWVLASFHDLAHGVPAFLLDERHYSVEGLVRGLVVCLEDEGLLDVSQGFGSAVHEVRGRPLYIEAGLVVNLSDGGRCRGWGGWGGSVVREGGVLDEALAVKALAD